MLHLIEVPVYHHYITDWRRSKGNNYEQRIHEVEMRCFTSLVFSTFGGCPLFATSLLKD